MATDEARWKEIARRFDGAKTSACERVLEALGFDPEDSCEALEDIVDAAIAASTGDGNG